jgi:predicted ester cyclase
MTTGSSPDLASIARRALEQVCARGDFGTAEEVYAADFADHVNDLEFRGLDGVRKSVGMYRSIFPDLEITVEDQVTEGDRVASRWTMRGTHRGSRAEIRGITISRFAGEKIVEDWSYSDTGGLLRQLGLRRSVGLGLRRLRSSAMR